MTIQKLRPSFTFTQDRLKELESIIPEAFADERINWDVLKEALGTYLEEEGSDAEHFGLFWPGKRDARRLATVPSKGTLKPAPGEGVDEDATGNIFIEGDNLEVLKLLQKSYAGHIKMIYIDPPYNTGNDFVYKDEFWDPLEDYLKKTGQADEEGKILTTNTKADGRFHSNWLSMMYPRLRLARTLLREDGAIFVSIDDTEMPHLKLLMNEIFGEENFVATLVWQRSKKGDAKLIANIHEYILIFC
jgi:adenine-specific DNA-methyltransferase